MSDSLKKGLLIALVALAVVVLGYEVYQFSTANQLQKGTVVPHSGPSLKQLELEKMKEGAPGGKEPGDIGSAGPRKGG